MYKPTGLKPIAISTRSLVKGSCAEIALFSEMFWDEM